GAALGKGEVGMVGASLPADAGPERSGLILVLDMIEEEEVRDDPFANRPDMLPSQRSIRLVTADGWCTLVLVSMEVENCIDVELSKARVVPRPCLPEHCGNQGIRPSVVGDANRSGCDGLDDAFAKGVEGRDGNALFLPIGDRHSHILESILHFLRSLVRECDRQNGCGRHTALQKEADPPDDGPRLT